MEVTIRNVDTAAYRALVAHAALSGKPIGEALSEAIRAYLAATEPLQRSGSLRDLRPASYPKGNERLSEEIDVAAYGADDS